jgi:hypothetical protein
MRSKSLAFLASLFLLGPAGSSGALAASEATLREAIASYNSGDYINCASLLEMQVKGALSGDAYAHYYLANAMVKLNRNKEARVHYEVAAALAPRTTLARYAKTAISGLNVPVASIEVQDRIVARPSGTPRVIASSGKAPAATSSPEEPEESAAPPYDPREIDATFIKTKRPTADTNAVLAQVAASLKTAPKKILEELKAFGITVLVTPGMLEADPDLATERPRGYVHGGGYTNCPAMYRGSNKTILIAERVSWLSGLPQPNRGVQSAMLHEMGHAFDHCRSHISASAGFSMAYKKDLGKLTNTQKNAYPYFTQEDGAGESELFAELFSFAADKRLLRNGHNGGLAQSFPSSFAYIQRLIQ